LDKFNSNQVKKYKLPNSQFHINTHTCNHDPSGQSINTRLPNKILFTSPIFKKIKFSIDKLFFNRTFTTQ